MQAHAQNMGVKFSRARSHAETYTPTHTPIPPTTARTRARLRAHGPRGLFCKEDVVIISGAVDPPVPTGAGGSAGKAPKGRAPLPEGMGLATRLAPSLGGPAIPRDSGQISTGAL